MTKQELTELRAEISRPNSIRTLEKIILAHGETYLHRISHEPEIHVRGLIRDELRNYVSLLRNGLHPLAIFLREENIAASLQFRLEVKIREWLQIAHPNGDVPPHLPDASQGDLIRSLDKLSSKMDALATGIAMLHGSRSDKKGGV